MRQAHFSWSSDLGFIGFKLYGIRLHRLYRLQKACGMECFRVKGVGLRLWTGCRVQGRRAQSLVVCWVRRLV